MTLYKRLIARLDIKGSRLIKGLQFEGVRVVGEPSSYAIKYASKGIDELFYVDSVASLYGRNSLADLLRETSKRVFIPITASGGIRSVEDASILLANGADKIAINTSAIKNPYLISDLVETFGSQCVVVSIQARKSKGSITWEAMTEMGREHGGKDVIDWISQVQDLGAGEIILTSIDKDGLCNGPDYELIEAASKVSTVPLIVGGGFSSSNDLRKTFENGNVSGISIGSALHKESLEIMKVKNEINSLNISMRTFNTTKREDEIITNELEGIRIGIPDYGIGNQQSLINALNFQGADIILTKNTLELDKTNLIAVPGVGAFGKSMEQLKKYKFDKYLKFLAKNNKPILGICIGMQILFESSEEFGENLGLGLIKGKVKKLDSQNPYDSIFCLPHMGWNKISIGDSFLGSEFDKCFNQYFLHSYAVKDIEESKILYKCNYAGQTFVAAVKDKNLVGLQFHPERSGSQGVKILTSLIKLLCREYPS